MYVNSAVGTVDIQPSIIDIARKWLKMVDSIVECAYWRSRLRNELPIVAHCVHQDPDKDVFLYLQFNEQLWQIK